MEYEVFEARCRAIWEWHKRVWQKGREVVGFLCLAAMVVFIPWFIWDLATHPDVRHAAGLGMLRNLKWYILWGVASWLISKIWRKKPEETENAEQPDIQSSEPKGKRKNHRRVQRGR